MKVKFSEEIPESSSVWAVFLIFIKNDHAEYHSYKQTFDTEDVRFSGYVIPKKKQVSENKG